MKEKCGIFGIYTCLSSDECLQNVITGLELLQHRGQESCGLSYCIKDKLVIDKKIGLVKENFKKEHYYYNINSCIGHVRYSTSGNSKVNLQDKYKECQPLYGKSSLGEFYLAHNGNIPNVKMHDTQYIINFIQNSKYTSWKEILIELIEKTPPSFCLLIITKNEIFALRDKYGIRPLCIGKDNSGNSCISSESCALQHYQYVRDVNPGEIIKCNHKGYLSLYVSPNGKSNICAFEYIYFMKENSLCNGIRVKYLREMLGSALAQKEKNIFTNEEIVVGVPESGICSAKRYAEELNLSYMQLINKNSKIGRTFIAPSSLERKKLCKEKFVYDELSIKDKTIIIIDDTIVRGTVMKTIISFMYKYGAKEIHVRLPSPPVIDKCSLGIDIPIKEELFAYGKSYEEMCEELNVSSINYLKCEEIDKIVGFDSYKECFGENLSLF
tara:strand:+ start:3188 stop:4507 length:1320 start_codon:yes stop_codon:yes gene_type:complete